MRTVFRTAELIAIHGRGAVRHAVAVGRWRVERRGVIVTHSGPLSKLERELVMLTMCAPASALGGLSALRHDKLRGFAPEKTFIVLPEGADRPEPDDLTKSGPTAREDIPLVTHWSTDLGSAAVHQFREPRRTRPARSLIDAASWTDVDRYARTIVIAGMQQGVVNAARLHEALDRRGTCHRRALIRESILDADGGIQSLPERDFDELRILAGLPAPDRQKRVEGPHGHHYLDAAWDEFMVSVEVHGSQHQETAQWDADVVRGNEILIGGRRTLIFTSYAIRHEPQLVIDQLRRMFATFGSRAA